MERRAVRRPHPPRRPSSAGVQLTGREPQQRQMTHLRHCLASLRVEPSANCFMLKSVPPAEPSLQSPWKKRQEPVVGLGGWTQSWAPAHLASAPSLALCHALCRLRTPCQATT